MKCLPARLCYYVHCFSWAAFVRSFVVKPWSITAISIEHRHVYWFNDQWAACCSSDLHTCVQGTTSIGGLNSQHTPSADRLSKALLHLCRVCWLPQNTYISTSALIHPFFLPSVSASNETKRTERLRFSSPRIPLPLLQLSSALCSRDLFLLFLFFATAR